MQSPTNTLLCRFGYDPLDRLTSQTLPKTHGRQRFYCKNRLTTEMQGTLRYSILQHDDHLLAEKRRVGAAPDTALLATDQQRSVLQMVRANHQPKPIGYTPYGDRPGDSGLLSLLGFNGERRDLVTGNYFLGNGYRAFNPVLMRFNSPDNLSPFLEGGLNAYAYCVGDPVNLTDPTGHSVLLALAAESYQQQSKITSTFGSRFISKPGINPTQAKRAYTRTLGIENEIRELEIKAQRNVLEKDLTALEGSNKLPHSSIHLELNAFEGTRQMSPQFEAWAARKRPSTPIAFNSAQHRFLKLLVSLSRNTEMDILIQLHFFAKKQGFDGIVSSLYAKRMRSITHERVPDLLKEKARIRDEHFQ